MRHADHKIYRTFEEFEREELRRMDSVSASVDEMIDTVFGEELDFEPSSGRRGGRHWADDDEE
jgi:hypothetical protein